MRWRPSLLRLPAALPARRIKGAIGRALPSNYPLGKRGKLP
jgi:hypothetical protein